MTRKNLANEKIKREFVNYLKEVERASETTIDSYLRAVNRYEEISKFDDFKKFSKDRAILFKKQIRGLKWQSEPILTLTIRTYFIHIYKFSKWLMYQPGYKSRIYPNDINYIRPNNIEDKQASNIKVKNHPNLVYFIKICKSINGTSEIDVNDKALIPFLFLTPIRVDAAISLSLGCINMEDLMVYQDPIKKVRTKFSENIVSMVLPIKEKITATVEKMDFKKLPISNDEVLDKIKRMLSEGGVK
jgi:integrase